MPLGKNLKLGETVYFVSRRYTTKATAIVTAISPSGKTSRRVSLYVFPSDGGAPFVATGVEHVSAANPECDSWDFLDASASVAL